MFRILKRRAPFQVKWSGFLRDLGFTSITNAGILVAGLITVSLLGRLMGAIALAEYLLLRRVMGWLLSGVQICSAVALPRYVAQSGETTPGRREAYFIASTGFGLTVALGCGAVLAARPGTFAKWMFGNPRLVELIFPLFLLTLGAALEQGLVGYYYGKLAVGRANTLQALTLIVIPIGSVLAVYPFQSVRRVVIAIALGELAVSAVWAIPILARLSEARKAGPADCLRQLLRYGIVRVPADFGLAALMALPPLIAAHYFPMKQVGYLLIGAILLAGVSASVSPLGIILLPNVSMKLMQNDEKGVSTGLERLSEAVVELSVFACLQFAVFADVIVPLWVGPDFLAGMPVIRCLILAIPFYVLFKALGSPIDAAQVTAHNSRNIVYSLAIMLVSVVGALITLPGESRLLGIALGWAIGFIVLAGLTALTAHKIFGMQVMRYSFRPIVFGLALGAVSLLVHSYWGWGTSLAQVVPLEACMGALFLGGLKKFDSQWLQYLLNMARRPSSPEALSQHDSQA